MPDPLLISLLFVLFLILGGQVNRAIYRLAWHARPIGPWSAPHPDAPARAITDRIPVWGWLGLERESALHGRWYWVRPLLIELGLAMGLVALFLMERRGGLVPALPDGSPAGPPDASIVAAQFAAHAMLILLMTAATFIDVDEKMIPDAITVTGTLAGLAWALVFPWSLLPLTPKQQLLLTSPNAWDPRLDGAWGLVLGLGIFAGWCLAIVPKTIWFRSGMSRGVRFLLASMRRYRGNQYYLLLWLAGSLAIGAGWIWGGLHWKGMLTALMGLFVGGGIVWSVRLVAGRALLREAMGFGDVTLMAMIGTFVGWQPSLIIFFLAPFAGAIIAIIQYLIAKQAEIAYGPFLCVATVYVLVRWAFFWQGWGPFFMMGWLIPVVLGFCLILMGIMLIAWRWLRSG